MVNHLVIMKEFNLTSIFATCEYQRAAISFYSRDEFIGKPKYDFNDGFVEAQKIGYRYGLEHIANTYGPEGVRIIFDSLTRKPKRLADLKRFAREQGYLPEDIANGNGA